MKLVAEDIKEAKISGVEVFIPGENDIYKEGSFEWWESPMTAAFGTNEISGGILKCWHRKIEFAFAETHEDKEFFYFLNGSALMLFIDVESGTANLETAQLVRIDAGTQIIISEGKGHAIPISLVDEPVRIVVVKPRNDAPRYEFAEAIEWQKQ